MENIPTDIIVYAIIAAGLLLWLRNILGTRNGSERQRPNPFTVPADGGKRPGEATGAAVSAAPVSSQGGAVDAGLVQIALADRSFDAAHFVENAKDAFALVVTAFAEGDRDTLKDLLAPAVYQSFEGAITAREKAGQKAMTEVLSVREADIVDARLDGRKAFITLRFKADESYALSDADGKVIAGNPERVVTMTDVWVFTRDVKSSDPRWFVVETRDDLKEEDARQLPEAGGDQSTVA